MKSKKGITLIALVVTIVILLILAGVTIGMLGGENGIITQAQKSKEETRGASVEEEKNLWKANQYLDKYGSETGESLTELINRLVEKGLLTYDEKDQILGNEEKGIEATGQVTIGSKTIVFGTGDKTLVDMFIQAETDGCTNQDGTCNNPNHLHIGDYMNYKNPTSGTYTINGDKSGIGVDQTYSISNNQLNWRVLGIDEETGGLKLIAASPMKLDAIDGKDDSYLYLSGAEAYVYGVEELNNICAMYRNNYSITARSINIDDINKVLGIETENQIKEYNTVPAMSNGIQYGESYNYENQYTPESWLDGKKQTMVSGEVTGYIYFIGEEIEGAPIKTVNIENTRIKNMLFDNTEYPKGKAYWIASQGTITSLDKGYTGFGIGGAYGSSDMAIVGIGGDNFYSDGREEESKFAVRPIVILKSEITKNEVSKIEDKIEEQWN